MKVQRLAAFSCGDHGGNPAGVAICETLPEPGTMQRITAEVGYSETVFAARTKEGFRVRYFAPEAEIPFCGHATIALGAALAEQEGDGSFRLELNNGHAVVEGRCNADEFGAAFISPQTRNSPAPDQLLQAALALFGLNIADLDPRIPPAIIEAGASHVLLALNERTTLAAMRYDMRAGAELMRAWGIATINLIYAETLARFHSRNPFASGGVYEDPATGAAAAALAGYLTVLPITAAKQIEILQGVDMGIPCLIHAEQPILAGGGARVRGTVRCIV